MARLKERKQRKVRFGRWHSTDMLGCGHGYHRQIGRGVVVERLRAGERRILSEGFDVFGDHVGWVGTYDLDGNPVGQPRWENLCKHSRGGGR